MPHSFFEISAATKAAASCFATFLRSGTHQENLGPHQHNRLYPDGSKMTHCLANRAEAANAGGPGCASGKSGRLGYAAKKRK
jgi:hypothetical protein